MVDGNMNVLNPAYQFIATFLFWTFFAHHRVHCASTTLNMTRADTIHTLRIVLHSAEKIEVGIRLKKLDDIKYSERKNQFLFFEVKFDLLPG
jgi:hypothetical protein